MNDSRWVWLNGEIIRETEAMIPAVQSGLFYGAGCFETMVSKKGFIFRYNEHLERMFGALRYLGLSEIHFPDKGDILKQIHKLILHSGFDNDRVRVRIQASLNENYGYDSNEPTDIVTLITVSPVTNKTNPARLFQTKTRVVPDVCRPAHFKLSNMLHYRNAFRKAKREGADDALMLTTNGFIAETATANVFWKKGNTIYTSSGLCDILPGIMREAVIEIIESDDIYSLKEGKFFTNHLMNADSIWLTNSVIEIREVQSINGNIIPVDKHFIDHLRDQLNKLKEVERFSGK